MKLVEITKPCDACKGTGKIGFVRYGRELNKTYEAVNCEECHGTGRSIEFVHCESIRILSEQEDSNARNSSKKAS